ncbi:MAG TPA: hypothetical protein VIF37_09635 [Methylobacter sp.]|jgi:hypothetical protein
MRIAPLFDAADMLKSANGARCATYGTKQFRVARLVGGFDIAIHSFRIPPQIRLERICINLKDVRQDSFM